MSERTKLLLTILLVAAAFGLVFLSVRSSTIADETGAGLLPPEGVRPAPDFTIPEAATGKPFHLLTEAKAHPIVLDFWATWCAPCRDELPHLQALSQRYKGRVGFYGVNSSDPPPSILAFNAQNGYTFPSLSDARHEAAFHYGANAIPLLVVVDTHGKVRAVTQGDDPDVDTNLPKVLDALLAEKH